METNDFGMTVLPLARHVATDRIFDLVEVSSINSKSNKINKRSTESTGVRSFLRNWEMSWRAQVVKDRASPAGREHLCATLGCSEPNR